MVYALTPTRVVKLFDGITSTTYQKSAAENIDNYADVAFIISGTAITGSSATFHVEVAHSTASTHNWVRYNLLVENVAGGSSRGGEPNPTAILRHFASTTVSAATTIFVPMDGRFTAPYVRLCADVAGGTGTAPGTYNAYLIAHRK